MEVTVKVPADVERVAVLGSSERHLKAIKTALGVAISARNDRVHVSGKREGVAAARSVLDAMIGMARRTGEPVSRQDVLNLIADACEAEGEEDLLDGAWDKHLNVYAAGRPIRAQTPNQERYLSLIRECDLVFGIGPAGTGKTYLAVAAAVHLLKAGRIKRLILTRPAVEAGEKLGFLPGDVRAKVNPYLRPLFDALADMMDYATVRRFMENDVVEVSPLAFMRGRTLNQAMIILDEAQNTTRGQMKMFLTRLGHGSKMVVTGDATQIDLPDARESGLIDAARRLARTPGVGFVGFDRADVVRHNLVQRIIDAYGGDDGDDTRRTARAGRPQSTDNVQQALGGAPMEEGSPAPAGIHDEPE